MKATTICIIYMLTHFVVVQCEDKRCDCEIQRSVEMLLTKKPSKTRYNPSDRFRYEMTPEEHEEQINRRFARAMQLLTFFGHIDNFVTDKFSGLIKIMGRAVDAGEDEQDYPIVRRSPRITTTVTS